MLGRGKKLSKLLMGIERQGEKWEREIILEV